MSGISLPAPGTLAAVDRGCTCAVHHYGALGIVDADWRCPLHGVRASDASTAEQRRDVQPVRCQGDAWGCP